MQILLGKACNEKVDIYSFGIVIWELCTGEQPRRCQITPCKCVPPPFVVRAKLAHYLREVVA